MARQCFLVSRPLKTGNKSDELNWAAIGNDQPIPTILDTLPILEHWALCVVPCVEIDPSKPTSRNLFLDATYFDLSVNSQTCVRVVCKSRSFDEVNQHATRWPAEDVMQISALQNLGSTIKSDVWVLVKGWQMSKCWGEYQPMQWNCQLFALLLGQISIGTAESANVISKLLFLRTRKVIRVREVKHAGWWAGICYGALVHAGWVTASFLPVAMVTGWGPLLAVQACMVGSFCARWRDGTKLGNILAVYEDLLRNHPELRELQFADALIRGATTAFS